MRRVILVVLIVISSLFLCFTLCFSAGSATSGFQLLRLGVGARPTAIAGAFVSIPGDLNSIYYNPAGLAAMTAPQATFTYLNHLLDFYSGFIAYGHSYRNWGVFGLGLNYISYGEFERTDDQGNEIGSFGAGSFSLTSSYARTFRTNILLGLNLKFVYSKIDNYIAHAVAFDFGGIYHTPVENLDVGFGIFNIGTATKAFIETREQLPLNYRLGLSKRLAHLPLLLSLDFYRYRNEGFHFALGGEFILTEQLFLRLGYTSLGGEQRIDAPGDRFAGLSLGLGFLWKNYHIDYSLSSLGEIGNANRLSLRASF